MHTQPKGIDPGLCACGKPLHYDSPAIQRMVEAIIRQTGWYVVVRVGNRAWLVPRHYLALHGLKARDLPRLGFEEITFGEAAACSKAV
jgi:hypothetical protein